MFDRKKTIILTLLSMIFMISSLGLAFDGQGRGKQNREDMFLNCLSSISLTADQEKAVEEIRAETRNSIKPLNKEMRNINLIETILSETIKPTAANKKIGETVELKSQICEIKQNAKLEIAELLTPEQRLELKTFIEKMKKMRQNNKGKRGLRRNKP
jgi:Spy/CpxP family protein refolding chaperone